MQTLCLIFNIFGTEKHKNQASIRKWESSEFDAYYSLLLNCTELALNTHFHQILDKIKIYSVQFIYKWILIFTYRYL